jgi:hypothetical protein
MIDPLSAVGTMTGAGAGLGLLIRIGGFAAGMIRRHQEEKTKRDAIMSGQINEFAKAIALQPINLREVNVKQKFEWKLFGHCLLSRSGSTVGRKPLFTLRQHAVSFTIYCWVSVYAACAAAFCYWPHHELKTIPPSQEDRTFNLFWGVASWDLPAGETVIISTGGVGWSMLATMAGVIALLVVGVAGTKN